MKRLALLSILASSVLFSAEKPYELGVSIGTTSIINEPSIKMRNQTYGLNLQLNNYDIKPRFDLEYVDISDKEAELPTSLLKVSKTSLNNKSLNQLFSMYSSILCLQSL